MHLTQTQARQIAKSVQGIATLAKPAKSGGWIFGGWATKRSQWVVLLPTGEVLSTLPSSTP